MLRLGIAEDRSAAYYVPGVHLVAGERKAGFYAFMFQFDKQGVIIKWCKEAYTEEREGKWLDMESGRESEIHQ